MDDREASLGEESLDGMLRALFSARPGDEGESVLDAIGRLADGKREVLLRDLPHEHSPVMRAPAREGPEAIVDDARYQVLGEIARGGVGIVYKARDRDLGRNVALKVLRPEHAENSDVVGRFIEEAQVSGQLQHPGIVPLYGLGLQPDDRPCFAMKLVKGQTLSARLGARADPSERRAAFLAIFERVCQTVAYAHARGVIHRDLKPSNVMTGAFGEVQVMDWGFAKVLGGAEARPAAAPEQTIIATVRSGEDGSQSITGSVMGTPAYMPPEQALGRVEDLDERTDVFALGAILTEILTGLPPYAGDPKDLLVMAAHARQEEAHARLDVCGAAPALVDLTKRCLAPLHSERPANAGAVAGEVHDHLEAVAEKARRAEVKAAEEAVRREEERARLAAEKLRVERTRAKEAEERSAVARQRRVEAEETRRAFSEHRKRRATAAVAAALVLAVVAGGAGWLSFRASGAARARAVEDRVTRALQAAEEEMGRGGAVAALETASAALDLAAEAEPETRERAAATLARAEAAKAEADAAVATAARDRAMAARLEEARLARTDHLRDGNAGGFAEVPALWNDAGADRAFTLAFREYGIDVDGAAPEAAARIRESAIREDLVAALDFWTFVLSRSEGRARERGARVAEIAKGVDPDPLHGAILDAILSADRDAAARLATRLLAESTDPRLLDLLAITVTGDTWAGSDRYRLADRLLRRAIELAPLDFWVRYHMSVNAASLDGPEAALPHAEIAASLRPGSASIRVSLAGWMANAGNLDGAESVARRALDIEPESLVAMNTLAIVAGKRGQYQDALDRGREMRRRAPGWSLPVYNMAIWLNESGDRAGALRLFQEATQLEPDMGEAHLTLATMLGADGRYAAAMPYAARAVELMPRHLGAYIRLARICAGIHEYDRAVETMERALAIAPDNPNVRAVHAMNLVRAGRLEEAEAESERALELDGRNFRALHARVLLLEVRGEPREALRVQKRLVRIQPWAGTYLGLGVLYLRFSDLPRALAAFDEAIRLEPEVEVLRGNRAIALAGLGRIEEAREEFGRALDLPGDDLWTQVRLAEFRLELAEPEEALQLADRLIERRPDFPVGHSLRGQSLLYLGRFREASESLRRGLAADERLGAGADGRFTPLGHRILKELLDFWLRAGDFEDRLEEIATGALAPADAAQARVFAEMCSITGRHAAADRLFAAAFAGDPSLLHEDELAGWTAESAAESGVQTGTPDGRGRALAYLRARLDRLAGALGADDFDALVQARDELWRLRRNPRLAPVRENVESLPADERDAWRAFWRDLGALLERALEEGR